MSVEKLTRPARRLLKLRPCDAVIVAAGAATRMLGQDKILADLGGKPVIRRTAEAFNDCDAIRSIVVVTSAERIIAVRDLLHDLPKVTAVVTGGATRQESVQLGLNALTPKPGLVAVHDGARPLVTWQLIDRVVRAANTYGAAIPAMPVKDTIKLVEGGMVASTPNRGSLRAVQTPQVFDFDLLRGAMLKAEDIVVTDESAAMERIGARVKLVEGDERNLKITTPIDLKLAKMLWEDMSCE